MPQPIFHMNEIAIIYYPGDKSHGCDCEIISEGFTYEGYYGHDAMIDGDKCIDSDSRQGEWFMPIEYLRKKRPPLTTWNKVEEYGQWNPTKVPVTIEDR